MKVEKGLRFDFRGGANLKVESLTWKINSYKTRGFATWRALGGRFSFEVWKGAIVAGLTHFVAAALPKLPICALKLGDRTSNIGDFRWIPQGQTRARDSSAVAPPPRTARVARFLGLSSFTFHHVSSWSTWIEDSTFGGQNSTKHSRTLFIES